MKLRPLSQTGRVCTQSESREKERERDDDAAVNKFLFTTSSYDLDKTWPSVFCSNISRACRCRTPRTRVYLEVPEDAFHQELSDATDLIQPSAFAVGKPWKKWAKTDPCSFTRRDVAFQERRAETTDMPASIAWLASVCVHTHAWCARAHACVCARARACVCACVRA